MRITGFRTNKDLETQGAWFTYPGGDSDKPLRLKIARLQSSHYKAGLQQLIRANKVTSGKVSDEDQERLTREAMARYILVGWENLQDDEGNDVAYSYDKAVEYLKIPDFFGIVEAFSMRMKNYQDADMQEAAGN